MSKKKPSNVNIPRVFVLGDRVTWASQAGGSMTTKIGTVIEVVAMRKRPTKYAHAGTRDHESYVVEVARFNHRTKKPIKSETYWPLAGLLKGAPGRKKTATPSVKDSIDTTSRPLPKADPMFSPSDAELDESEDRFSSDSPVDVTEPDPNGEVEGGEPPTEAEMMSPPTPFDFVDEPTETSGADKGSDAELGDLLDGES